MMWFALSNAGDAVLCGELFQKLWELGINALISLIVDVVFPEIRCPKSVQGIYASLGCWLFMGGLARRKLPTWFVMTGRLVLPSI
jgi:hypothetical protein